MKEYRILNVKDLQFANVREIRENIKDEIKKNIQENGYYDARVLAVIKNEGDYLVADGNHRLKALQELRIKEVPCLVYDDKDIYQLAIEGNNTENTYAPMDLFDWLSIIRQLKDKELTQQEIGNKIGWDQSLISRYYKLIDMPQVLDFCKQYQKGRVNKNMTNVIFDFSEGWFRTSGLYNLQPFTYINEDKEEIEVSYQLHCLERFVKDKCNWSKQKLQQETAKYKKWQEFIEICEEELHDQSKLEDLIKLIENNTFKTTTQLRQKIEDFNKEAKNKLICGDAIEELEKLEDTTIDIVIEDPPYGQEYKSNRSEFNDHIAKEGVKNDNETAFELLDQSCEILERKTKSNAHFYIFCSWKTYPQFKEIIEKYYEIKNVLIWDKMNHGAGDLEGNWADRYEMIIFAIKGNRPMTKRKANIIPISRISPNKLRHPTEKPIELIKELLEASAQPNDTICDPFMGSGSTIKACIEFGDLNYIGIEIDKEIFEKAKAFIGDD